MKSIFSKPIYLFPTSYCIYSFFVISLLMLHLFTKTTSYIHHKPFLFKSYSRLQTLSTLQPTTISSHESVLTSLRKQFRQSIIQTLGNEYQTIDPMIIVSNKNMPSDYQCNIAMSLSKQLKKSPKDIANQLCQHVIVGSNHMIEKIEVAGPGFINIYLSQTYLQDKLLTHFLDTSSSSASSHRLGIQPKDNQTKQKIIVDFSSPNIAKEMHVGHLRSTIIGDAISRILTFLGHDVVRLNHVGDWGTQFGMLIHYLKTQQLQSTSSSTDSTANSTVNSMSSTNKTQELEQSLLNQSIEIKDLASFYKNAKQLFDSQPSFQEASRLEVVKLQAGNPENIRLWQIICEKSRQEFQSIYELLQIQLQERGESYYNTMLPSICQEMKQLQLAQESQGALCIFIDGFINAEGQPLPLIIQKADGGYLYGTTDLAAIKQRITQEHANRIIYVVDDGQSQHFQMVFAAAKKAGYLTDNIHIEHCPFGLVLGEDGKKIKTRSGESIKLKDLLQEAIRMAKIEFIERQNLQTLASNNNTSSENSEAAKDLKSSEGSKGLEGLTGSNTSPAMLSIDDKARIMGLAAVKYADLSMNRVSNYRFSFTKMLSMNGNTAPYMLYANARIRGIKDKIKSMNPETQSMSPNEFKQYLYQQLQHETSTSSSLVSLCLETNEEKNLIKQIIKLEDVLLDIETTLCPNKLCDYMYDLAQKFNHFYEHCSVLHATSKQSQISRSILCVTTSEVLELSLDLLGIQTIDKI